jgi:hypothetical protein
MRKYLLAAVATSALGAPAHAALNCGAARVDVGDPRGGVVSTYIAHDPGSWAVKHTLANGTVIDRSVQYVVADYSNANVTQWRGTLMRNPAMTMAGELMTLKSNGQPTYDEWLYKNGQLIMHSVALCQFDNAQPAQPAYVPQPSASGPTPLAPPVALAPPSIMAAPPPNMGSVGGVDAVPITMARNAIYVDVSLGGTPATMLLDTGANVSSISTTLADNLVAAGQAKAAGQSMPVTLADGSTIQERVLIVNTLTIGAHTRRNVRMLVSPDGVDMLLGLPVLNAIGKFTIDAANSQLLLG